MSEQDDFENHLRDLDAQNEQLRKNMIVKAQCIAVSIISFACLYGILGAVNRNDTEMLKTLLPVITAILGFAAGKLT